MCFVQNKIFPWLSSALIVSVGLASCLSSCSSSSSDKAKELLTKAEEVGRAGHYQQALDLLDSLDHAYQSEVDVRRQGMALRPRMVEQLANMQLQQADSIAAVGAYKLDTLLTRLKIVDNAIENYYVAVAEGGSSTTSPGLHPRMSTDGRFYMVATSPKQVGATSVTVSVASGESATSATVAYDGERNDRYNGADVITFIEAECIELGKFVFEHSNEPMTLTFNGGSSVATQSLSTAQREAIAIVYECATVARERKKQELEKQRLTRMLDVARSQIARTLQDSIVNE